MNCAEWLATKKAEAFNAGVDPAKFSIPPEQIWRVAERNGEKKCREEFIDMLERRIEILTASDKDIDIEWSAALRSVVQLLRLQDK